MEEENYSERSEQTSRFSSSNTLTVRHVENASSLHFKYDSVTIDQLRRDSSDVTYKFDMPRRDSEEDSLSAFCPIEVHERKFLRNLQQAQHDSRPSTSQAFCTVSNSLQIPVVSLMNPLERPPSASQQSNVYTSENMTIIDTDVPVS